MHEPRTKTRPFVFILKGGALAALLATLLSALLIAVLSAFQPLTRTGSLGAWDIIKAALLLLPITAVSCGSYGFLAGIVGTSILSWRNARIQSTRRLVTESAILGFLLGLLFPLFDGLLNHGGLNDMQALFSAPTGMCCAILSALALRTSFVTKMPSIP